MENQQEHGEDPAELSSGFVARYCRTIKFSVYDTPVSQGSTRAFIVKGKPVITSTAKGLSEWRQMVKLEAKARVTSLWEGPVDVTLRFHLKRPKSAPKKITYPAKRPDLDKLVRAVLDAITGTIVADDSQVVSLTATKEYGLPGVEVEVREIQD